MIRHPAMANILTAEQLVEERQKATKKQLPTFGSKDLCVTGSEEEKEKIRNILSITKSLLADERVEKSNLLSNAEWDKDLKLAKVTKKVGKFFETFGHSVSGCDYLYPEEALFLLENSNLELIFGGLAVSIQRGYSILLNVDTGCSLNEYRVYSYLSKSGYRVFRHNIIGTVQNYEKQTFSKNVDSCKIIDSVEQVSSLAVISCEVTESRKESTESGSFSRTTITDTPSPSRNTKITANFIRKNSSTGEGALSEIISDQINNARNHSQKSKVEPRILVDLVPFIEKLAQDVGCFQAISDSRSEPTQVRSVMFLLKEVSQHLEGKRLKKVLTTKQKGLIRKVLLNFSSAMFFPPENQSLFNADNELIKNFTVLGRLVHFKRIFDEISQSGSKLKALSRDEEFTGIAHLFPTFVNNVFHTVMPPRGLLPRRIHCKYSSTTINAETQEIMHGVRASTASPFYHLYDKNQWSQAKFHTRIVPSNAFKNLDKDRYIGTRVADNSMLKLCFMKRKRDRMRALMKYEKNQRKAISPRAEVKLENTPRPSRQRRKENSVVNNMEISQSSNSKMLFNEPLAKQFPPGHPNQIEAEVAGPSPFIAHSMIQTPLNQQTQVKSEFLTTENQSGLNINQMNLPLANQSLTNQHTPLINPMNPLDPNILGQMIANVVSQLLPNQTNQAPPNQMNPIIPNQMTPHFQNPVNSNFPNQMTPFFQNPVNANFSNQMNTNFPNQGSSSFFNQATPSFNQNFGPPYSNQRFQRPFNNYGNNNNNLSEVTRHARKMHGMAKRMLAVAQAMFKNPEEFSENPENINIYNFSNRFRNPNNQRPWRHPNQNSNDNYRNSYRPRLENNFNNFNSNFGGNSFNSDFGQNFHWNRNLSENSNSQNDSFRPGNDENNLNCFDNSNNQNDSLRPKNDENNLNCFDNSNRQNNSFRHRNDENNSSCFENSNDTVETKFNPNATTPSAASNSPASSKKDNLFFVDVIGENPSNLLSKSRTIPASKPTIKFTDKRPAKDSSSSESSESESDNDDIQVVQPSKKKPEVETIDVLSSDDEIFMSISSKVNQSKQLADKICSKFSSNLKTKNPVVIDIESSSKKRRLDSSAEVITLDDDVTIIDCEPVLPATQTESAMQNSSSKNSSSSENIVDPKDSSTNETAVIVKQEKDSSVQIKMEKSVDDCGPALPLLSTTALSIKQEAEIARDNISQGMESSAENTTVATTVKREPCDVQSASAGETENQNLNSSSTGKSYEQSSSDILVNVSIKSEEEVGNINQSVEGDESNNSETDEESDSDSSSNEMSTEKSVPRNDSVNIENNPEGPILSKEMNETSNQIIDKLSVIEKRVESNRVPSPCAGPSSEGGWAVLKAGEKAKESEAFDSVDHETAQQNFAKKPTVVEMDNSGKGTETKILEASSSLKDEPQALLQPHHCKNLGTVLNTLQIFKSEVTEPKDSPLKISFDVYQPKKVFGKASRPDPDFRIIVTGYMDPVPSPVQIDEIKNHYSGNIKILFAVVHPSSISFFFIGNVHLPVQLDDVLF